MRIAVFGSWRQRLGDEWHLRGTQEDFIKACRNLGARIAHRGHTIIVSGKISDPSSETADTYIVEGAIEEVRGHSLDRPIIESFRPDGSRPYESEAREFPEVFAFHTFAVDQTATHLLAIREADSILIIGGASGSYHAGIAGIVCRKRVVPIGSFGGAGERLLDIAESIGGRLQLEIPTLEEIGILRRPWTMNQLDVAVRLLGICDNPQLLIIHGRSQDWRYLKDYLQNNLLLPEPIVMGQRFGNGRTLPEKFEQLALRVDAAIAVVTPDDLGTATISKSGIPIPEDKREYELRARQNVWLEIGWFWGNLGRNHVLLLQRGRVETPSDLQGLEQYTYDREPKEAGEAIRSFIGRVRLKM